MAGKGLGRSVRDSLPPQLCRVESRRFSVLHALYKLLGLLYQSYRLLNSLALGVIRGIVEQYPQVKHRKHFTKTLRMIQFVSCAIFDYPLYFELTQTPVI